MSSVDNHFRDQQVRWIENKLGSNELWGGKQASVVLTREILVELETCFQLKEPLLNLLEVARRDPDDWVETVADIFRKFPDEGLIQCASKVDSFFNRTQLELERILAEKVGFNCKNFQIRIPPDSELIPQSLLKLELCDRNGLTKHFGHREKTTANKSSKLLEDVKKSVEQQNNPSNKKNHGLISSFPIKIRSTAKRLDNNLPMRGISSTASALKMSGGFTNESKKYHQRTLLKRTGGAMLLDIDDLPKKNRKRRNVDTITLTIDKKIDERKDSSTDETSHVNEKNELNENNSLIINSGEATPAQASSASESVLENQQKMSASSIGTEQSLINNNSIPPTSLPSTLSFSTGIMKQSDESSSTVEDTQLKFHQTIGQMMAANNFGNIPNANLTTLQQFESMLKDANKLTPSSHNLIISFLLGNKHNPFEEQIGPVITLPFSESVEFEPLSGGKGMEALLVETYFQMDYRTGEWKRLKNSRVLDPEELNRRKDQLFGSSKQFGEKTLMNGQNSSLQQMFFQSSSQ